MANIFDDVEEAPKTWGETAVDAGKSAAAGLRLGAEGLLGMPGDIAMLMRLGTDKLRGSLGYERDPDYVAGKTSDPITQAIDAPMSSDVHEVTSKAVGDSYEPETTTGKYTKTISSFLPGAMTGGGGLARNALTMGVVPGAMSEAAGQATEGTDLEPWARTLGALTGGVMGGLAGGRPIPRTAQQTEREALVEAAHNQGVHLPAAAMPDATLQGYTAGKVGQIPFLGAPLRASADRTVEQLGGRLDELANAKGGTNFQTTANQTRDVLNHWQTHTSPAQMTQRYDAIDNIIAQRYPTGPRGGRPNGVPPTTPLSNTMQTYRDVARELAEDTTTSAQSATRLVEDAITRPGGLTYEGLKRLRTDIGARISGSITPEPGTNQAALNRLYGSLTEDLRMSVYRSGGAPGLRAWEEANDFAREIKARQTEIARIIGVKGQNSAENIVNRMLNLASDTKAGGSLELLRTARRAVAEGGGAQAWDDLGAALIRRIGRDPSSATDVFSPDRFLTAMGKFGEQHADVLFGRGTMRDLRELRQIAEAHRNLMRQGNPSGTGGVVTAMSLGTGMFAAPLATLGVVGGGLATSAVLARPASRQALVNWARVRNGYLESRTPTRLNALMVASQELAPYVALESKRDEGAVARELAGEPPAQHSNDIFGDLE